MLKPETTTGLFKHGRASAQVAGRGGGLPDLAFNEMRFLQKPKDHQDAVAQVATAGLSLQLQQELRKGTDRI
ncbi:hypothetical protein BTJ68_07407 [Hortaea werneckii EXF-2000]|uniref:Uncharacterized protein n=1 Tax=Hortaea werneckii EXF-2000 TaxID=1157616 RepID=A0A1Z5TBH8_HORWE|nr:hypothetical protein BTJ68_07407 [Hortaea werneckii EXF-2000]